MDLIRERTKTYVGRLEEALTHARTRALPAGSFEVDDNSEGGEEGGDGGEGGRVGGGGRGDGTSLPYIRETSWDIGKTSWDGGRRLWCPLTSVISWELCIIAIAIAPLQLASKSQEVDL